MPKLPVGFYAILYFLVGCAPTPALSAAASTPISLTPTPVTTQRISSRLELTPEPAEDKVSPPRRVRITIATTSDWTTLKLLEGGTVDDYALISSSDQALSAGFDSGSFSLSQPLDLAEAGGRVELVSDISLTELDPFGLVLFEVDRGHIGTTQVEISSYPYDDPSDIALFEWDGISTAQRNTQVFEVPSTAILGTEFNEYVVIAQLNFWYYGPGRWGGFEDDNGNRTTPLTPLLGKTYRAGDPSVVHQQIEWAVEYGVDAFSIEWTTPRGIGCCGSMEDTLDDVFLKASNIRKIRWAIFYDFVLRLDQTPGLEHYVNGLDFDVPDVYNTFVSDFAHFARKYFGHPQYLTIDERPVVYVWASNAFVGNLEGALRAARQEVAELGFDVFIVGDEIIEGRFTPNHASLFDANTTFTFLIPGLNPASWTDLDDATTAVDLVFETWRSEITDLKVSGREENVNFQPAWAPQYDDRLFVPDHPTYVPAMSKDQVAAMAEMARRHAQPVGVHGQKLIWLNTWNNWAETTTVEPTANLGPKYPAGNYQFDLLEVVRDVFGADTFPSDVP